MSGVRVAACRSRTGQWSVELEAGAGAGARRPSGRVTLHVPPSVREPRRMRFVCDVMCAKAALPKPRSFTL